MAGVIAPVMSDSSSRGPNQADLNVLKPDITAPGTDIIAAYTNTSITAAQRLQIIDGTLIPGPGADMISGTSMASPHVAGAAALLRQANPTWSPFAIKSALMTSAQQTVKLANGAVDPNRFGFGAGHLNPNGALDTRVVYDQTNQDHLNYYNRAIDGRQLNLASLTHAEVPGVGTLTRSVTNKDNAPVTYNATANLPGYLVTVQPAVLTIPAGGSASYTVTMRRTTAAIGQWSFGEVTWSGTGLPAVRSPLTAKGTMLSVLSSTTDTRAVGTKIFTAAFGYDGSLFTSRLGLLPATVIENSVSTGFQRCHGFTVPAGAKLLRAQLFNADTEGGAASDLDLIVQRSGTTIGSSFNDGSNELVSISNPAPATDYRACVQGFAPLNGSAAYKLSLWVLGPTNPGSMTAFGPSKVVIGGMASIGVGWNVPPARAISAWSSSGTMRLPRRSAPRKCSSTPCPQGARPSPHQYSATGRRRSSDVTSPSRGFDGALARLPRSACATHRAPAGALSIVHCGPARSADQRLAGVYRNQYAASSGVRAAAFAAHARLG